MENRENQRNRSLEAEIFFVLDAGEEPRHAREEGNGALEEHFGCSKAVFWCLQGPRVTSTGHQVD